MVSGLASKSRVPNRGQVLPRMGSWWPRWPPSSPWARC